MRHVGPNVRSSIEEKGNVIRGEEENVWMVGDGAIDPSYTLEVLLQVWQHREC